MKQIETFSSDFHRIHVKCKGRKSEWEKVCQYCLENKAIDFNHNLFTSDEIKTMRKVNFLISNIVLSTSREQLSKAIDDIRTDGLLNRTKYEQQEETERNAENEIKRLNDLVSKYEKRIDLLQGMNYDLGTDMELVQQENEELSKEIRELKQNRVEVSKQTPQLDSAELETLKMFFGTIEYQVKMVRNQINR